VRRRKRLTFDSLLTFINRSRVEIARCKRAKAYLAGCSLLGATLEYSLTAMMRAYPHVVYVTGKRLRQHWDLGTLNQFARACGWFDHKGFLAAERIRKNRNMLHPNWYASRRPPRITRTMLDARLSDFDEALASLRKWVEG